MEHRQPMLFDLPGGTRTIIISNGAAMEPSQQPAFHVPMGETVVQALFTFAVRSVEPTASRT